MGVPTVPNVPFVTQTMEKAIATLLGSIPQVKPYTAIKGKARADGQHQTETIMPGSARN